MGLAVNSLVYTSRTTVINVTTVVIKKLNLPLT